MENTNIYERQTGINLIVPQTTTVIGCGGTGFWTALFLGMSGVRNLHIYDGDIIEIHNLNRLPFTENDIGKRKSDLLADYIKKLRPNINIVAYPHFEEMSQIVGVVFDCTDSIKIQEIIKEKCRYSGNQYLRIGCSHDHITIDDSKEKDEWSDKTLSGYERVPSWCGSAVLSAILGVMKHYLGLRENIAVFVAEIFKWNDESACEVNEIDESTPSELSPETPIGSRLPIDVVVNIDDDSEVADVQNDYVEEI